MTQFNNFLHSILEKLFTCVFQCQVLDNNFPRSAHLYRPSGRNTPIARLWNVADLEVSVSVSLLFLSISDWAWKIDALGTRVLYRCFYYEDLDFLAEPTNDNRQCLPHCWCPCNVITESSAGWHCYVMIESSAWWHLERRDWAGTPLALKDFIYYVLSDKNAIVTVSFNFSWIK